MPGASFPISRHAERSRVTFMTSPGSNGELAPRVYDELRRLAAAKLAAEPAGHTLDATALVHEAYLRLATPVAHAPGSPTFATRSQFFRPAAEALRRILVDHARRKPARERGCGGT